MVVVEDKGDHIFPKGIILRATVITRLEFELVYHSLIQKLLLNEFDLNDDDSEVVLKVIERLFESVSISLINELCSLRNFCKSIRGGRIMIYVIKMFQNFWLAQMDMKMELLVIYIYKHSWPIKKKSYIVSGNIWGSFIP